MSEETAEQVNAKAERKTEIKMLRNYQADEKTRLTKGETVTLSSKLANQLVRKGIASADAAISDSDD